MGVRVFSISKGRRILKLEEEISSALVLGKVRKDIMRELDELIARACVMFIKMAVKQVNKAFVTAADDRNE